LGIIDSARKNNIINIDEALDTLNIIKNNNFRISDKFLNDFINYMKIDNEKKIKDKFN
jgi:predicted nucleic acid-binding protein